MSQKAEYVVLHRNALFRVLGENIDCAPLVQQIIEWVEFHDLADLYQIGG